MLGRCESLISIPGCHAVGPSCDRPYQGSGGHASLLDTETEPGHVNRMQTILEQSSIGQDLTPIV